VGASVVIGAIFTDTWLRARARKKATT